MNTNTKLTQSLKTVKHDESFATRCIAYYFRFDWLDGHAVSNAYGNAYRRLPVLSVRYECGLGYNDNRKW